MLAVGTQAPDFSLFTTPDQKIKLSELKGKRVILAFYNLLQTLKRLNLLKKQKQILKAVYAAV